MLTDTTIHIFEVWVHVRVKISFAEAIDVILNKMDDTKHQINEIVYLEMKFVNK